MKSTSLFNVIRTCLIVMTLAFGPMALMAFAQNTPPADTGGTSTQTSRTTVSTTQEEVAPRNLTLWIVIGVVALLAILLIVVMASRGRSTDRVTTVHEHNTVVKKE